MNFNSFCFIFIFSYISHMIYHVIIFTSYLFISSSYDKKYLIHITLSFSYELDF